MSPDISVERKNVWPQSLQLFVKIIPKMLSNDVPIERMLQEELLVTLTLSQPGMSDISIHKNSILGNFLITLLSKIFCEFLLGCEIKILQKYCHATPFM